MPDQAKEYLTQEKFEELSKELDFLKNTRRKEIAESLEYAKSLGDISENAEYHEARDLQANLEDRIAKLEDILKRTVIVDESEHQTDVVNIGSTVTVQKEKSSGSVSYKIVGSEESDMGAGNVSIKSPFGSAALGKKKGESFSFKTPAGEMTYTIIEIK